MSLESVLTVTPAQLEQMHSSYGRTKEQISEDVQLIRDWIKKQPHLPPNEDVVMLERLLKFNKFSVERTKRKIDYYYAARNFAPEYLQNNHPLHPSMQKVLSYTTLVPMPKLSPDFGRVLVSRLLYMDNPEFSSIDCLKGILMTVEFLARFDSDTNDIIIFDMINTNFANTMSFRPMDIRRCYDLLIRAFSLRIGGFHFFNAPTYAMGFIKLLKHLLTEKMKKRLQVHSNLESLHEYVPKELLPKDYGGNELPLIELHKNWVKFMESENDWMLKRADMKTNEKLRIGKPLDIEVFGTEGTFRKINVD